MVAYYTLPVTTGFVVYRYKNLFFKVVHGEKLTGS